MLSYTGTSWVPITWISISLEYSTDSILTADSNIEILLIDQDNHTGHVIILTNIYNFVPHKS